MAKVVLERTHSEHEGLERKGVVEPFELADGLDGRYIVGPVSKALQVLTLLADREQLTLTEAYQQLGTSKSQMFRYLYTLRACGFAEYDAERNTFSLGLRSWELGRAASGHGRLLEATSLLMQALRDQTNETVNLGVVRGTTVVYIGMVESRHALRMQATLGASDPIYATSLGKAILAFLPEDQWNNYLPKRLTALTKSTITSREVLWDDLRASRERGYAIDQGENEHGACCVGAPIFDKHGKAVAAVSISAPASRLQGEFLEEGINTVKRTASQMSERLKA